MPKVLVSVHGKTGQAICAGKMATQGSSSVQGLQAHPLAGLSGAQDLNESARCIMEGVECAGDAGSSSSPQGEYSPPAMDKTRGLLMLGAAAALDSAACGAMAAGEWKFSTPSAHEASQQESAGAPPALNAAAVDITPNAPPSLALAAEKGLKRKLTFTEESESDR
jgi:hypothetical protein